MVLDLAGLLRGLGEGGVRFVVIGGIAVAAHRVVRATEDVDVMQRPPGVPGFDELDARAGEAELLGARFRVCSLEHLIAMKKARGAASDRADLERLTDA